MRWSSAKLLLREWPEPIGNQLVADVEKSNNFLQKYDTYEHGYLTRTEFRELDL